MSTGPIDLTAGAAHLARALDAAIAEGAEHFTAKPSDIRWVDVRLHREWRNAEIDALAAQHREQLQLQAWRQVRR